MFHATRGADIRGDIAIDQIEIRSGACQGMKKISNMSIPSTLEVWSLFAAGGCEKWGYTEFERKHMEGEG